jgi:uroporphyrinogen decarboxylase
MKTAFARFVMNSPKRIAMPIGVYAGLEMTGATVRDAVSSAQAQFEAQSALHEHFHTPILLTAMDLSAEAETFGCQIRMTEDEIPTVIGRRATSLAEIQALPTPEPGDKRTRVHLETARSLTRLGNEFPVLGGLIGPFSLAGRIFGVSEALEATMTEPEMITALLEHATAFLIAYAKAFREIGAAGVIMAEPAAGLLSPNALAEFSSSYVRRLVDEVQTDGFTIVLHNCGARLAHLQKILESGAEVFHFGAPMDLLAALSKVTPGGREPEVILAGNLDPTAVFHNSTSEVVHAQTCQLLKDTAAYRNYIVSSGCDIPPGTPIENLATFYQAVAGK